MPENKKRNIKKIYYFNITYSCNNCCVFCYSHNTCRKLHHNEIDVNVFISYFKEKKIAPSDRIIINGGEPLMHERFTEIMHFLRTVGCEVLIYTNGTFLSDIDTTYLNDKFRFIVPIHGNEIMHDTITLNRGSYSKTIHGMEKLLRKEKCLIDLKVIVNHLMLSCSRKEWKNMIKTLREIPFNHDVQLTKMAETIVSRHNMCPSLELNSVAFVTADLIGVFRDVSNSIKIYDTCIKGIEWILKFPIHKYSTQIEVLFKDYDHEHAIDLVQPWSSCRKNCLYTAYCISAVHEYKTMEITKDLIRESLE